MHRQRIWPLPVPQTVCTSLPFHSHPHSTLPPPSSDGLVWMIALLLELGTVHVFFSTWSFLPHIYASCCCCFSCRFLLQGIFLTQGSNLRLQHSRWIFYCWVTGEALSIFKNTDLFVIGGWLLYNVGLISVIHQHALTIGVHRSPASWISLPPPTPLGYYRTRVWVPQAISKFPLARRPSTGKNK